MCTSGRVQQPQHQPGLELGRRRSLALGPSLTHSGEVCMLSLRYKDWMHLTKQNQRHHISKCLPRSHQRVPRSRSAQRAARQCWRRFNHRVGIFFFDPAHNHFIWLGVDLLYIFYVQGWELICYIFAIYFIFKVRSLFAIYILYSRLGVDEESW